MDAVTIATFPSSLQLTAAVELILIALKVPKHNFTLELRSVIFQAFFTGFRVGLEISSPYPSPNSALCSKRPKPRFPAGGGGVLPYTGYIGFCGPEGYGFSTVSVINRVSILADFGHFGHKQGMVFAL